MIKKTTLILSLTGILFAESYKDSYRYNESWVERRAKQNSENNMSYEEIRERNREKREERDREDRIKNEERKILAEKRRIAQEEEKIARNFKELEDAKRINGKITSYGSKEEINKSYIIINSNYILLENYQLENILEVNNANIEVVCYQKRRVSFTWYYSECDANISY